MTARVSGEITWLRIRLRTWDSIGEIAIGSLILHSIVSFPYFVFNTILALANFIKF